MCQKRHVGVNFRLDLRLFMRGLKSDHAVSLDLGVRGFVAVRVRN